MGDQTASRRSEHLFYADHLGVGGWVNLWKMSRWDRRFSDAHLCAKFGKLFFVGLEKMDGLTTVKSHQTLDPSILAPWKKRRVIQGGGGSMQTDRKDTTMTTDNVDAPSIDGRLRVEYWPLDRLIPYARNARTHSPAQVAEIAGSIRAFGFSNPILVGEDADVIAGHGRLAAARKLALAEVPVIMLRGLSESQRRQLVLADNRIALNAGWDAEMLGLELTELSAIGADLSMLGFSKKELATALSPAGQGLTDEDEVPLAQDHVVSAPGDIWQLGPHRIACGDSTSAELVKALLGGVVPQLMVTDPPYGVEYDPEWRHRRGVSSSAKRGKIKNDEYADWSAAWALFPGQIAYVWHGALRATIVADSLHQSGFTIRAQIIWAKERLVMSQGDYHWQHEPCWYAVRKKGNWTGDRKQTTLWTIPTGGQDVSTKHSTQKPVECMRRPILNNSDAGQAIYEPFLGSGTTLIAAESTGRVCYGIEIDPVFVDVVIRRWQAFTGQHAVRSSDGALFDDAVSQVDALALSLAMPVVEEAS